MAYCAEHALPHDVFLDTWSAESRSKLMAYLLEQNDRCGRCGTAAWEWEEDRFAYAPVEQTCPGCSRKESFQNGLKEHSPGSSVALLPKDQAAALRRKQQETEKR